MRPSLSWPEPTEAVPWVSAIAMDILMSSTVTGLPSDHLASGCMCATSVSPLVSQLLARPGKASFASIGFFFSNPRRIEL